MRVTVLPTADVRTVGDSIAWQPGAEETDVPVRRLLDRFVALAEDRDGSAVARFVEEFGGLGACRHAMPPSHASRALGDDAEVIEARMEGRAGACVREQLPPQRARMLKLRGRWYVEPITMWRGLAIEAAAVLRYVDAFRRGDDTAEDADALTATMYRPLSSAHIGGRDRSFLWEGPYADAMTGLHGTEAAGALLAQWIGERWMVLGNVRPTWTWEAGAFHVNHRGDDLMGAVAIALGARVAQIEAGVTRARPVYAAVCSNCGASYAPSRRPAKGRRNYCDEPACKTARYRDSKRDERAKARADRGMDR